MQPLLKAPPTSREGLKRLAKAIRKQFGITTHYFPVDVVLEFISILAPGYRYEVMSKKDMGDNHGLTHYHEKVIRIREDVYDGACRGEGRDRMTVAHEIGHAILHTGTLVSARDFGSIKTYEDPEWQATAFAGHLLVTDDAIASLDAWEIEQECGVSYDAAVVAERIYKK